ncbi:unnamed protein product [Fraxinus pennsylvanica]|uniref:WW domain-containing protein n=1 Tax=Fraxinus pennsylvanica TaxID=56036 RepID=A0AAD1YU98_9LAMI|nr:unnamed protein product [Fraxinus pennsylvanica]
MATIKAIDKSLQNCSLNHQQISSSRSKNSSNGVSIGGGGGIESGHRGSATSDSPDNHHFSNPVGSKTVIFNTEIPLPEYWEQFFDLKTGEFYYKNWKTGKKVTEDPRTSATFSGDFYPEDDGRSYDREGSSDSSESSPQSSTEQWSHNGDRLMDEFNGLVAVGCKGCLMYYMVPKLTEDCPKCHGPLIRF